MATHPSIFDPNRCVDPVGLFSGSGSVHTGVEPGEAHDGGETATAGRKGEVAGTLPDGPANEGRQSPRAESRRSGPQRRKVPRLHEFCAHVCIPGSRLRAIDRLLLLSTLYELGTEEIAWSKAILSRETASGQGFTSLSFITGNFT